MTDSRKAVVLLSGGMDSCVSTAIARERHGAENLGLLHVGYGQRTQARERRAFEDIADFYGVRDRLVAQIDIMTPVITLKKSAIIQRGIELGAPLHLTWSCYQNEDIACGACDSCLLRLRAFAEAGVPDPIAYRRTISASR